jgi:D-alanine-D-alanine ligase
MKPRTVLVLGGGTSAEREVSLHSSVAVAKALRAAGYEVREADPADISEEQLTTLAKESDVTFPALHGTGGEDGKLQRIFEQACLPFVGADSATSALCFNKVRLKTKLVELGITTPVGEAVTLDTIWASPLVGRPFVLKPSDGGSSIDTFVVHNPTNADKHAIEAALHKYPEMLLEELIEGQEITLAVVFDEALPVIEIIPPTGGEFDYENKYNGKTTELCPPEHISEVVQRSAQAIALRIHKEVGIKDISRTDIMVRKSDMKLFVLETNTMPGMTEQSLVPKAAAVAGYDMRTLCGRLVDEAYQRIRA